MAEESAHGLLIAANGPGDAESPVELLEDETAPDPQHHEPRRFWFKYGNGLLLATLVLSAVAAGGTLAKTFARSPARSSDVDLSAGLDDVGDYLSIHMAGNNQWQSTIEIYNGIAAPTYNGTNPIVLHVRETIDTPGHEHQRIGLLQSLKASCEAQGGELACWQVSAAYDDAISTATTTTVTTATVTTITVTTGTTITSPAPGQSMDACSDTLPCAPPLTCGFAADGTRECVSPLGQGGQCTHDSNCLPGLECNTDSSTPGVCAVAA